MQKRLYFADSKGLAFAVPVANLPRKRVEIRRPGLKIGWPDIVHSIWPLDIPTGWSKISRQTYRKLVKNGRIRK